MKTMNKNQIADNRNNSERTNKQKEQVGSGRKRPSIRSMGAWNDLISQRIEDAAKEGAFDNLRGSGKPQKLDRNPFAPEGMQMAFDLLQNNDLTPGWITDRKAILNDIAALRKQIEGQTAEYRSQRKKVFQENQGVSKDRVRLDNVWREKVRSWQITIDELNQRINTLNLTQSLAQLELIKLDLDDELLRVGATQTTVQI